MKEVSDTQLRVAFDGDAVLFSDESERICKAHGLDKFFEHEKAHENKPLDHGPLKGFLEVLGKLQKKFYGKGQRMDCPIRTYLVTARSAASSAPPFLSLYLDLPAAPKDCASNMCLTLAANVHLLLFSSPHHELVIIGVAVAQEEQVTGDNC
ncbi:cytosolic 5'-nucleotidase 1A-like isoform X1 [Simochromis diagramma]|uniref:cytosolic 5'-nucleotidase 1A-like isoform X1 n=1 Tax=Simochromis diagramma TaxID=43689 RepID=UPI001A7ED0BE|nr:cytosolic 5'-nucleotidase 1A-like isoform X1 [Simochromis diagramma]XP_039895445.1 cytosolic 5'-nucleotidase 1A-like isoform X1 [Simochromis diagramma]